MVASPFTPSVRRQRRNFKVWRNIAWYTSFGYAKRYDAVIEVTVNGQARKFALEYERCRKAKADYEGIAENAAREARVPLVLYRRGDHPEITWISSIDLRYNQDSRMRMNQITFTIPDEIRLALKATPDDLASRIRFAASAKLYEMGQLSSGAAAQLAGVPKPYFLSHLADYGVNTFDLSEEELSHDLKNA